MSDRHAGGVRRWRGPPLGLALAGLLAAGVVLPAGSASAATSGLVIGINDYIGTANDLDGAVNDANDIAQALVASGATVDLLIDGQATKAAIHDNWYALIDEAAPGDTIIFSYAGHGSQEPEPAGRGGEDDGLNENFLLGGYQPSGPGTLERIVDDEMFEWLKAAQDKGLEVIFVADSCHSGTMYRSVGSNHVRYRTGNFADPSLADDLLRMPPAEFAVTKEDDFNRVTFVGAVADNRLDPEVTINGQTRGALSWAFSRAIEGAADKDGDGALSQQELLAYLVPTVQIQAENQQIPSVAPLSVDHRPVVRIAARPNDQPVQPVIAIAPEVLVKVFVRGSAGLPAVTGTAATADEATADLIWDPAAGTVDHRIGGRVAEGVGPDQLPAILSKYAALAFLKAHAAADPVDLALATGNQTYRRGDVFNVTLEGATLPYLTLFNLPPDGRVEFFMPANSQEALTDWRGGRMNQRLRVQNPPFGAEHLVAILTAEPATALHAALQQMGSAENAAGLAATLETVLAGQQFQAGIVGIYTTGGQ